MNYSDLITLILTQLRTHVNSDQFLEQFRRSKAFVRHRKHIKAGSCLSYLFKKRSMDIELSTLQRQIPDIEFPDVSTGSLQSQAWHPARSFQGTF
ncbi:hypothetical protein [[Ruminococcus] lactaris]|uniref:hypothetical protein n=1 Tax=[Ruminococcus] lactaris TaxID=46228 RepID=UPI0039A19686